MLKAAGQHLARYQRLNIIRIGRVQSAGSAEGVGHIPLGRRDLHIVDVLIGVLCLVRAQDEPSAQHGHAHHRHHPFPVLAEKGCCFAALRCGLCLTRSHLLYRSILLLFKDHACCFLLYLSGHALVSVSGAGFAKARDKEFIVSLSHFRLLHKRLNFVLTHLCQSFTQLSHRALFCLPDKTKETVPRSCRVLPLF